MNEIIVNILAGSSVGGNRYDLYCGQRLTRVTWCFRVCVFCVLWFWAFEKCDIISLILKVKTMPIFTFLVLISYFTNNLVINESCDITLLQSKYYTYTSLQ